MLLTQPTRLSASSTSVDCIFEWLDGLESAAAQQESGASGGRLETPRLATPHTASRTHGGGGGDCKVPHMYVACCHGLGLKYLTLGTNISGEDWKVPEAASMRYGRMAAVRVMGCDWRHRRIDEALLEADLAGGQARMKGQYLFECEGGLVCGAGSQVWRQRYNSLLTYSVVLKYLTLGTKLSGAQPPLHLWGFNLSLEAVRSMGRQHQRFSHVRSPPPRRARRA